MPVLNNNNNNNDNNNRFRLPHMGRFHQSLMDKLWCLHLNLLLTLLLNRVALVCDLSLAE
eukprot:6187151-Amphidinium_carterae.1